MFSGKFSSKGVVYLGRRVPKPKEWAGAVPKIQTFEKRLAIFAAIRSAEALAARPCVLLIHSCKQGNR
jgi:hypothetical protein